MKHGDFRYMVTTELYAMLEKVVNAKSDYPVPYYIQAQIDGDYRGPAAVRRVSRGKVVGVEKTREVNTDGKRIVHTRLVLMNKPPSVPQLGTLLFKMDNRKGLLELVYALPIDAPHGTGDSDNDGRVSRLVFESASKLDAPLIYQ